MIISSYELELAREHAVRQLRPYSEAMADDPPAQVHVLVHVDADVPLPADKYLGASLFILQDAPVGAASLSNSGVELESMAVLSTGERTDPLKAGRRKSSETHLQSAHGTSSGDETMMTSAGGKIPRDHMTSIPLRAAFDKSLDSVSQSINESVEPGVDDIPVEENFDMVYSSGIIEDLDLDDESAVVELTGGDQSRIDHWIEAENIYIDTAGAREFTSFAHSFDASMSYQIRVEFFLVATSATGEREESDLGYAVTTLRSILDAPNEQLDVDLVSMDHAGIVGRSLFGIEWVRETASFLAFEVRIKVNRKHGWPFSSHRPFYMLYRQEYDGQWIPLYLSEVRVKPTKHPFARGCMLYNIAEVNIMTANGGNDNRVLRIEFFHYKTTEESHKFLGSVTTSVMKLRHAKSNTDLGLQVNTFPNSELVGSVILESSLITSRRSWFCLYAQFGGEVKGHLVYIDFTLEHAKPGSRQMSGAKSPFSTSRPHYRINRVTSSSNHWEVLYCSERPSRQLRNKRIKYRLTKMTAEKLTGKNPTRRLAISIHNGEATRLGQVYTSLSELVSMPQDDTLPISFATVGDRGYLRLEQKELTESHTYLALRCVLGSGAATWSDSDGESGSIVQFDANDLASVGSPRVDNPITESSRSPATTDDGFT